MNPQRWACKFMEVRFLACSYCRPAGTLAVIDLLLTAIIRDNNNEIESHEWNSHPGHVVSMPSGLPVVQVWRRKFREAD